MIPAQAAKQIRVLIADDHRIFAEGLRALLERTCDVIGIVGNGYELQAFALEHKPDLIIADVSMPLLNGLEAVRRVLNQLPNTRVIFLTMHDDPNLAAAASQLGPVGFVLKHEASREMAKALEHVCHGRPYVTPKVRSSDWVEVKSRVRSFSKELTQRQSDVVQLWAEGRTIKEIAAILNVSEKTVEFHKHQIMAVHNLRTNADLVLFALRRHLIWLQQEAV